MNLKGFHDSLTGEIQAILSSDFTISVTETETIPNVDDPGITYPNFVTKIQKCKLIETCVLYVDIRKSTDLNLSHRRNTLAKLYSSFVRVMVRCGEYFSGKVRNIVGDRVMVLFDKANCFINAVNTAILMNSVCQYVLNKTFPYNEVKCGIGIDYGKMLIAKTGIIKQGLENTAYKSLVWLGRPANVASKLTDVANKQFNSTIPIVRECFYYPTIREWSWINTEVIDFLYKLKCSCSPVLFHSNNYFSTFNLSSRTTSYTFPPILMTEDVFNGFKKANPDNISLKKGWWKSQSIDVPGYNGIIYGGDVIFTDFKESC